MPPKRRQPKRMVPEVKVYLNKLLWTVFELNQQRGYQASLIVKKQLIEVNATGGGADFSIYIKPTDARAVQQLNLALVEITEILNGK